MGTMAPGAWSDSALSTRGGGASCEIHCCCVHVLPDKAALRILVVTPVVTVICRHCPRPASRRLALDEAIARNAHAQPVLNHSAREAAPHNMLAALHCVLVGPAYRLAHFGAVLRLPVLWPPSVFVSPGLIQRPKVCAWYTGLLVRAWVAVAHHIYAALCPPRLRPLMHDLCDHIHALKFRTVTFGIKARLGARAR
jgi:hypothetical protein